MAVNLATDGNATDALKAQADAVLEAALKGGPDQVELLQLASYLRHVQGRFDEEMGLYRRLDALQPEAPWYLNNMAWTLSEDLGQPEAALPVIDRLLKLVGDHPSCRDTRGTILLRMGKTGPAIEEFRRAVEAEPANAVYHYHLARAYLKDGQREAFRAQRDLARKAGLKPAQLQASERAELDRVLAQ
jgi:tetratricopeptide (TPR) repeat protein